MNLQDYLVSRGAEKSYIRDSDNEIHLKLIISEKMKDRFSSWIAVFDDEPKKLFVLRFKMSGLHVISNDDVIKNFNDLHTNFKNAYLKFLKDLKENYVDFELNNESY